MFYPYEEVDSAARRIQPLKLPEDGFPKGVIVLAMVLNASLSLLGISGNAYAGEARVVTRVEMLCMHDYTDEPETLIADHRGIIVKSTGVLHKEIDEKRVTMSGATHMYYDDGFKATQDRYWFILENRKVIGDRIRCNLDDANYMYK